MKKTEKQVLIVLRKLAERPGYLALIQENNAIRKGAANPVPYFNIEEKSQKEMEFKYAYLSRRAARHLANVCSKSGMLIQENEVGSSEVVLSGTVLADKTSDGYRISNKPMRVKPSANRLTPELYQKHLKATVEAQKKLRKKGRIIDHERCRKTIRPAAAGEINKFASSKPVKP